MNATNTLSNDNSQNGLSPRTPRAHQKAGASISSMRGLDIRANYAQAMVMAVFDEERANDVRADVEWHAHCQGVTDFRDERNDVPVMLRGVPELVERWQDGWNMEAELADMPRYECSNGSVA